MLPVSSIEKMKIMGERYGWYGPKSLKVDDFKAKYFSHTF